MGVFAFSQAAPSAPAVDTAQPAPAANPVAAPPAPTSQTPAASTGAAPSPIANTVAPPGPPASAIAQANPPVNPASGANPPTSTPAPANPAVAAIAAANPAVNSVVPASSAVSTAAPNPAASPVAPAAPAGAQPAATVVPQPVPAMNSQSPTNLNPGGGFQIQGLHGETVPWSIVILLTGLTLIPTMLLCVTPFARLLIVFHFLRQALGLQTTPSNQTLIGLSLILTFFLMQPVGQQIYQSSVVPMQAGQITAMEAVTRGEVPMRKFMAHYVREKDVALFVELAKEPQPHSVDDLSMRVLLPAYILSELKAGFQIGTVLFLPFLIVDMVVASITTSVGMLQLPPVVISTPLKLLLFLMVDGWHLLISSLMRSFS
jgi:flagellar biosynthetic protein FliP